MVKESARLSTYCLFHTFEDAFRECDRQILSEPPLLTHRLRAVGFEYAHVLSKNTLSSYIPF